MEYLRYCSSLLHFPPYYLGNNSWWGGYFLRVIWRKWGLCLRPIIQRGMYRQEISPTLSPYAGPITVTASQQVAVWFGVFRCKKYAGPTFVFSPVSYFSGVQNGLVILEMQKAAPLPKGNFSPKGQWVMGCQAAKGEIYNRQYMQYTTDKIHNQYMIAVTHHVLIAVAFTAHLGRLHKQQEAAHHIWKISALYRDKSTDLTTHSELLLRAISWHP